MNAHSFSNPQPSPAGRDVDHLGAQAEAAGASADDERANLADVAAERRKLAAADQSVVLDRHEEAMRVRSDFVEPARQQMSLREVLG